MRILAKLTVALIFYLRRNVLRESHKYRSHVQLDEGQTQDGFNLLVPGTVPLWGFSWSLSMVLQLKIEVRSPAPTFIRKGGIWRSWEARCERQLHTLSLEASRDFYDLISSSTHKRLAKAQSLQMSFGHCWF